MKRIKGSDKNNNTSYTKKDQGHNFVCIDDKFTKPVVLYIGENAVYKLIDAILEEYDYCTKVMNFNKNFVMSVEDEKRFQSSNKCWI